MSETGGAGCDLGCAGGVGVWVGSFVGGVSFIVTNIEFPWARDGVAQGPYICEMPRNPIVLVHGYSDDGAAFKVWERILEQRGYDVAMVHACSYRSLTNEVTIKDIAEGFDRALQLRAGLDADEPFDAIVHSTGMLVIRAWLTAYAGRRDRLKHLIGLAPATFGSPLAHKGRSC